MSLFGKKRLTLRDLVPSPSDQATLQSLSKAERVALWNLCEILHLTSYDEAKRAAAKELQEVIRKNTLHGKTNICDFDKTGADIKMEKSKEYLKTFWPKKK